MIAPVKSYVQHFSPIIWILTLATLVESTGRFIVIPYLSLYLKQVGTSAAMIGIILSASPFATILFSVVGGHLSDTIGRKPVQILGVVISGLALIGFAVLPRSLVVFGMLSFLSGMTTTFYRPASNAAVADITSVEHRAEAYGFLRVAYNSGFGLGSALGLFLFTMQSTIGFWVAGILNLLVGVYIAFAVPETSRLSHDSRPPLKDDAEDENRQEKSISGWMSTMLRDHVLWTWLVSTAISVAVYDLIQSFLPIHLSNSNVPLEVYSLLLTMNGLMCVILQVPISRYFRSSPIGKVYFFSKLPYLIGFLGFGFLVSPFLLVVSMFIFTLGEIAGAAVTVRFIPEHAPSKLLGKYLGVSSMQEVGRIGMSIAAGFIFQSFGGQVLFAFAAALSILAGFIGLAADSFRLRKQESPRGVGIGPS